MHQGFYTRCKVEPCAELQQQRRYHRRLMGFQRANRPDFPSLSLSLVPRTITSTSFATKVWWLYEMQCRPLQADALFEGTYLNVELASGVQESIPRTSPSSPRQLRGPLTV